MKLELLLQIIRGRSAMYSEGYAASDAEAGFVRAMQLCEQMGRIPQIFPVMYGLWALYLIRGKLKAARQQAQRFIALAAEQGNTRSEMLGHGMMGLPLCWMGALAAAHDHLERLEAWYEPQYDAENTSLYGQAALLARLTSLPMVLCMQGFADPARDKCSQFVQMSETLADPISWAFALSSADIVFHSPRRRTDRSLCRENCCALPETGHSFLVSLRTCVAWLGVVDAGGSTRHGVDAWQIDNLRRGRNWLERPG